MNHRRTRARPYAKAIFDLACEDKQLVFWSQALSFLSQVSEDKSLQAVYHDARYSASELSTIFIGLLKKANLYHQHLENLIFLLAHYKRLPLLPMIALLYEEHKTSLEKMIRVDVTSAFPMTETIAAKLKKSLEIRLQRAVELSFKIDKTLMGGAVIRAGDLVIDGSVRSKLEKLKQVVVQ